MQLEIIKELIEQHLNVWTVIVGCLCLVLVLISTLSAKDLRLSIYFFLLAVVFTSSGNRVMYMSCYILRWLILILITTRVVRSRLGSRFSLVQGLFALWAVIAIMSAFQAPSVFRGLVFGTVYLLCFFVFFILVLGEITDEQQMYRWLKMLTYLAWTFVLLSFIIFISNPGGYRLSSGRLAVLFAGSGIFARALVFSATIILWSALTEKGHPFRQVLCYATTFGCVFLVFLSGSRASLAGFAIMLAVFGLRYRRKVAVFIVPALAIGAIFLVPRVLRTASTPYVKHMTTLEAPHRPVLRELGIQRFKERPILGWGLGSLSDPYGFVCPQYVSFHNVYLNWLVEFGLVGFVVVMIVMVYTWVRVWRLALFSAQTEYIKNVAWFIGATLTSLFVWEYVEGVSSQPAQLQFYWLLLVIVLAEALARANQQIEYGLAGEYLSEDIYEAYGEGTLTHA